MAGFKLACERSKLFLWLSVVVCYERRKTRGVEGPTFVVLRQTERNQPFIVLFLMQQQWYAKRRGAHAWRTRSVCLLETTHTHTQMIILNRNCMGNVTAESIQWHTGVDKELSHLICHHHRSSLTTDPRASTINHFVLVVGVQEVVFCLAGGFGCYAVMGENMIRGSQGRRDGEKMEGDGMREGGSKDGEGGWGMRAMGVGCQSGGGGGWWNIQWECASGSFPLFFLSTSLADSFIYWGPCGSRNSFAVVLPLHTKRTKGGR